MKRLLLSFLLLFTVNSMVVAQNEANSVDDIKIRTKARLSSIKQMKASGAIGENNKGLLEILIADKADKSLIEAENKDRSRIYNTIAKKTSSTPSKVAMRRMIKIREIAEKGEMLQDNNGKWNKK